jgi:putative membrane protein
MTAHDLPPINASLNGLSAVFIIVGWILIKTQRTRAHIVAMSCALVSSTLFLACYLTYHFTVRAVTHFTAQGLVRPFYFALLISHTILAGIALPLVILTVLPALRARYDKHRRIARWTLPVWLYVSVTGVLVYLMLYQWFPPLQPLAAK